VVQGNTGHGFYRIAKDPLDLPNLFTQYCFSLEEGNDDTTRYLLT
jgi:hypothetical protein